MRLLGIVSTSVPSKLCSVHSLTGVQAQLGPQHERACAATHSTQLKGNVGFYCCPVTGTQELSVNSGLSIGYLYEQPEITQPNLC